MEKRAQRLLERVEDTQSNCRFEDIARLLEALGYEVRATGSSHHVFRKSGAEPISIPFARPVKSRYVRQVLAVARLETNNERDNNEDR
jgi:predicted RNA binding protein YcfA (HicA-like mRNA interferase family)